MIAVEKLVLMLRSQEEGSQEEGPCHRSDTRNPGEGGRIRYHRERMGSVCKSLSVVSQGRNRCGRGTQLRGG